MENQHTKKRSLLRRTLGFIWIRISKLVPNDRLYLRVLYRILTGEKLNFASPETFCQKIQWLKLYNKSNECTQMVDKYGVRAYIREKIGEEYLIPCYGVYNSFDDIDFSELPDTFVMKTTHDSGGVVICKDKSLLNYDEARKKLERSLKRNYFWVGREYPYKNVQPRIVIEKLMSNEDGSDITDYKFFCFNGEPQILFYASERFNAFNEPAKFDYYDMYMNHLDMSSVGHKNAENLLSPFPEFSKMKDIARTLSTGFPHLRVDLYLINGRIYFGELTFHHDGGFVPFLPSEWNKVLGDMIILPRI